MNDRPFLISGLFGLGALGMTLLLSLIGPGETGAMPPGFITPVVAFEFAETEAEVWELFRPAGSAAAMDRVNRWDFLYMTLYGLFLFTFAVACARRTGRRFFYIPAGLALFILLADALENAQLLGLTYQTTLDGGSMDGLLARLRLFTWLKWGGLAAYFALLWPFFQKQTGLWRVAGAAGLLPMILAVVAAANRGLPNELLALSIGLMFVMLTVYSWKARSVESGRSPLPIPLP